MGSARWGGSESAGIHVCGRRTIGMSVFASSFLAWVIGTSSNSTSESESDSSSLAGAILGGFELGFEIDELDLVEDLMIQNN